jgi:MipA family protein
MHSIRRPRHTALLRRLLLSAAALTVVSSAAADPEPLWEFGMGGGFLVFNDYRGAATQHLYPVPIPYFVYRGKFFRSDRDGVRGKLLEHPRIELNLCVNATTPVRNDSARSGMPDLRPTLEIGPALAVHLWESPDHRLKLDVRLPVRAAFTVELAPRMIGVFVAPNVSLDIAQFSGADGWKLGVLAGPLFADRRYDQYFYSVAPQYATAARPAYDAAGGYAGTQALLSLTRRYPRWWVGAYLRHDTLAGASFADSPLVKRDNYWSMGCGIAWMIQKSTQLVESEE